MRHCKLYWMASLMVIGILVVYWLRYTGGLTKIEQIQHEDSVVVSQVRLMIVSISIRKPQEIDEITGDWVSLSELLEKYKTISGVAIDTTSSIDCKNYWICIDEEKHLKVRRGNTLVGNGESLEEYIK